jgi:hypothetical protein
MWCAYQPFFLLEIPQRLTYQLSTNQLFNLKTVGLQTISAMRKLFFSRKQMFTSDEDISLYQPGAGHHHQDRFWR